MKKTPKADLEKKLQSEFYAEGGFLAKLATLIPWEEFRETLNKSEETVDATLGGRPAYDKLTMFKCLILQEAYGLSDKALEKTIKDRLSFRFFIGVNLTDSVPDRLTIMRFRNRLATNDLQQKLFNLFYSVLEKRGLSMYRGTNASTVTVESPRLRRARPKRSSKVEPEAAGLMR